MLIPLTAMEIPYSLICVNEKLNVCNSFKLKFFISIYQTFAFSWYCNNFLQDWNHFMSA